MQLRSGKKIGAQGLTKPLATATPIPINIETFELHMKYLLKCVSDSPSESMDRINCMRDVMHWASLDENIILMRPRLKWTETVLSTCDRIQFELLNNVANRPPLSLEEQNIVRRTHNILAETRYKYQNNRVW